ncbi:MAG: glycoside hydrolase family 18 protein [Legionellaceae bacterium]|nr:glycoside hydrolase family 18 protein [Legionellaceae bacterium]
MSYYVAEAAHTDSMKPDKILQDKLDTLTILAYAFSHVDPVGNVIFNARQFSTFLSLQNPKNHFKKTVSLGGADDKISFFNAIKHPHHFVRSLSTLIHQYELSGVDLDFEINRPYTPQEANNLTQLVVMLRQELGAKAIISITTIIDPETLRSVGKDNWRLIAKNTNFISMMCFDLTSSFYKPAYTELASNLYLIPHAPNTLHNANLSCDESINIMSTFKVPNEKMLLGLPAYGVSFGGVGSENNGLFQAADPALTPIFDDLGKGLLRYSTIIHLKQEGFQEYTLRSNGHVNGVWSYNAEKHQFITYDNPETVRSKMDYVFKNHLAGIMIWRVGQDVPIDDKDSLLSVVTRSIKTP